MKFLLIFLCFLLGFFSCRRDEEIYCSCNQNNKGKLCRKISFVNDEIVGYSLYSYNENGLIEKDSYYENNGAITSQKTFKYDSLFRISEKEEYIQDVVKKEIITYNSFDSINTVLFYTSSSLTEEVKIEYNDDRRRSVVYRYASDSLFEKIGYYYYSDLTLWKVNNYSNDNKLLHYDVYTYYDNSISRMNSYDNNNSLIRYTIEEHNNNSCISKKTIINSEKINYLTEEYEYDLSNRIIKKTIYGIDGKLIEYFAFEYY